MTPLSAEARLEVAAVQLSSQEGVAENLAACAELGDRAAARGTKLVVFPENFAFMGPDEARRLHAERVGDPGAPIQRCLAELARRHRIHVVGGGMPEASGDPARPYNTLVVFSPSGELLSSYRKIHLFDVDLSDGTHLRESAATTPGQTPTIVSVDGFTVGLSICYDLRFPELYRALAAQGAHVLLVPAAFTLHTGKDHWHVLLRARAIESQAYVVAPAQWGKHPRGRTTYGHALVADPWGTVVAECPDGPGLALATIEASRLTSVRGSLPSLLHGKL